MSDLKEPLLDYPQQGHGLNAPAVNQQNAEAVQNAPVVNQQNADAVQNAPAVNQQNADAVQNAPVVNQQNADAVQVITNMEEFKTMASDFAYFEVKRKRKCKYRGSHDYTHHFLTFNKSENYINVIFYEQTHFGDFHLRSKLYDLEEDTWDPHVNFERDDCSVRNNQALGNLSIDNLRYLIENVGKTGDEIAENKISNQDECFPMHAALTEMYSATKDHLKDNLRSRISPLSIIRSFGFFITLVISIIAVAYCSNIQQAHVRIFIAMYSHFEYEQNDQMNDFQQCTDDYGQRVIDATRERISLVVNKDYRNGDPLALELMENITKSLNTKFVCDIASAYGHENILKTTISLLVIWVILQSAFIVIYDHEHLKSTVLDDNKIRKRIYNRSLIIEIIAGFLPMGVSAFVGFLLQHVMLKPTVAYVFCVCLSAAVTRIIVVLLFQICYNCHFHCSKCTCNCYSHKKFSECCCVLFTILVVFFMIFYIICILFHFLWPEIFDIM